MSTKPKKRALLIFVRVFLCLLLLMIGFMVMQRLGAMKKPPSQAAPGERAIRVEVTALTPTKVPVVISGFGQVQSLNTVKITPEVSGRVVAIHDRLETGETVPAGEVLVRVDDRDYKATLAEASASKAQLEAALARLRKQFEIDQQRLVHLKRNRELVADEFERLRKLFETDQVGTRSGVETAERAAIAAADQVAMMEQTVAVYPIRIAETQQSLKAAQARVQLSQIRLQRCVIRAPFRGRIAGVSVEMGEYLTPGRSILSLADDSVLEIVVPIDSRDARNWLQFDPGADQQLAWFDRLLGVQCNIQWTEAEPGEFWQGRLHRVVKFDQQTRTVQVAVRITADQIKASGIQGLPLVEGMFCRVEIPGRELVGVFKIPKWAVTYENKVYLAVKDRLITVSVKVAKIQGNHAIINQGLQPGDRVIVTRLVDPLENALLAVVDGSSG